MNYSGEISMLPDYRFYLFSLFRTKIDNPLILLKAAISEKES